MNIQRKCRHCHEFFPVEPMELKFFCDKPECRDYMDNYHFYTIKSQRCISLNYFDIFDFDRPRTINDNGEIIDYERVCRVCGALLANKDGKYSVHRRYCGEHNGYELWSKYNWGEVRYKYTREVRDNNIDEINKKRKAQNIEEEARLFTICELCGDLVYIWEGHSWNNHRNIISLVNIHHKLPVHKIVMSNIHLIWDYSNLIALCKPCHNKQDHFLKKTKKAKKYRMITSYF